ncbi:hypothetical protein Scel_63350 [Streptomyces cellostaticus]|nr:hypothetical protein Scel_63350 [Streptomyces cellostaticus]
MQKSTGPDPSLSRASAAIEGLCAAVLRNNEVTLSGKGTSVEGWPVRGSTGRPWIRRGRQWRSTHLLCEPLHAT